MRKCTFKAVDRTGKAINKIEIKSDSYETAVCQACDWFQSLEKRDGLHLVTTADFKYRMLSMPAFERVCQALNEACPDAYEGPRQSANARTAQLLDEDTKLIINGSAIPPSVLFPYTGSNHVFYLWTDERRRALGMEGYPLMNYVRSGDYRGLAEALHELHIAILDLADLCLNVKGSGADKDILCYCVNEELLGKVKKLGSGGAKVISVSGAVKETMDVLNTPTQYRGLVRNPKKKEWSPLIDWLLTESGKE